MFRVAAYFYVAPEYRAVVIIGHLVVVTRGSAPDMAAALLFRDKNTIAIGVPFIPDLFRGGSPGCMNRWRLRSVANQVEHERTQRYGQ